MWFYFTNRAISLNLGCLAVRKRAKRAASVLKRVVPASRSIVSPICLLLSVREETASAITDTS